MVIWIPLSVAALGLLRVGFGKVVQVAAVGALPLGFNKKLQILRTKSGPSALQASPIFTLRIAFCAATWSSKMPLAKTGAALSMLDPERCNLGQVSHDS